jgi:hypothetical protein
MRLVVMVDQTTIDVSESLKKLLQGESVNIYNKKIIKNR